MDVSQRDWPGIPFEDPETLHVLLDMMPDGVGLIEERRITYANQTLRETLGYCSEDLLGRSPFEFLHPDDHERARQGMKEVIEGGSGEPSIYRLQRKDGSWVPTKVWSRRIERSGGPVMVSVFRDVSERLARERSQKLLSAAVEQSGEAIMLTNADGEIQYVNPAFQEITGYTREEVVGLDPRILKSPETDEEVFREMWETLLAGEDFTGRFVNRRKDGVEYWHEATISPVRDETGKITHFLSSARDVSENVQLEEQLHRAQKMEAIGELTGSIAHDFNNLLTAILGPIDLAIEALGLDSEVSEELADARESAQRATALTRQLLTFSRKSSATPQVMDVNEQLENLLSLLRRLVGTRIELEFDPGPGPLMVLIDPSHLEQITVNLVVNARDAMPEGGRIRISTERVDGAWDDLRQREEREPVPHVILDVQDEGEGIAEEERLKVFEPFYTTKDGGTGLGLSTVYGIVTKADGFVRVESEPGAGSAFRVFLPVATGRAASAEGDPSESPRPVVMAGSLSPVTERVLIVEDEEVILRVMARALRRRGYSVRTAKSGADALRTLDAEPDFVPDLLITDVVLSDMGGPELADALLEARPELSILFTSGYSDDEVPGNLQNAGEGTHRFLEKPFSVERLLSEVRESLLGDPGDRDAQEGARRRLPSE